MGYAKRANFQIWNWESYGFYAFHFSRLLLGFWKGKEVDYSTVYFTGYRLLSGKGTMDRKVDR